MPPENPNRRKKRPPIKCYINITSASGMRQVKLSRIASGLMISVILIALYGFLRVGYYVATFVYAKSGLYKARIVNLELQHRVWDIGRQSVDISTKIAGFTAYEDYARLKFGMDDESQSDGDTAIDATQVARENAENSLTDPALNTAGAEEHNLEKLSSLMDVLSGTFVEVCDSAASLRDRFHQMPSIIPTYGSITSPFGWRMHPIYGEEKFHTGIDVANTIGSPVHATADGEVVFAGWDGDYGNRIELRHKAAGYSTFYAHLLKVKVSYGDEVKRGQVIGYVGSTGNSTGPHCHYEVRRQGSPINPAQFILPTDVVVD